MGAIFLCSGDNDWWSRSGVERRASGVGMISTAMPWARIMCNRVGSGGRWGSIRRRGPVSSRGGHL